ncbi:MAG: hypothetical protein Q4C64_06355 [Erysipelotrichia bacterium]|nr:hypothetical protein [Erysipelotrichia bacterium]
MEIYVKILEILSAVSRIFTFCTTIILPFAIVSIAKFLAKIAKK